MTYSHGLRALSYMLVTGILASSLFWAAGCESDDAQQGTASNPPTFRHDGHLTFVSPNDEDLVTIDIEIADTDQARAQGLMHRRSMGYDKGMLFIFDEEDMGSMWMRNTPLPLDMIFVSGEEDIINIVERTRPFSDDAIEPEAPRKYVIEVRAGFVERYDIDADGRIRWSRLDD